MQSAAPTVLRSLAAAMQKTGVRRLVISSTPSAADPNDLPESKFKLLFGLLWLFMRLYWGRQHKTRFIDLRRFSRLSTQATQ